MRRKEIQRHVAPVASLLRVLLHHGEQLNRGHPKEVAPMSHRYTRICSPREPANMQFVDHQVRRVKRHLVSPPLFARFRGNEPEWRLTGVGARHRSRLPAETSGKAHAFRIRIYQNLVRVEAMALLGLRGPRHLVTVIARVRNRTPSQPAMPDETGLVCE